MRRKERAITNFEEQLSIVHSCDVCRLALNDGGYPYLLPLNFGAEVTEGTLVLYFHGAMEGKKYDLMAADPRASFEMDGKHRLDAVAETGYCTMHYASLIGRGLLSEVTEEAEKARALDLIVEHYHLDGFTYNPAAIPRTRILKLTVEQLSAKGH